MSYFWIHEQRRNTTGLSFQPNNSRLFLYLSPSPDVLFWSNRFINLRMSSVHAFDSNEMLEFNFIWIQGFDRSLDIFFQCYARNMTWTLQKKTCASTFWAPTREEIDRLCIKSVVCASVWQIPSKTIENLNFIQVNFSWKSSKFAVNGPFNITLMNFMNTLFTFSIENSTDVEISWMYNETINIQQS